jgi:serine phosphatase RsbU (regulator of sigma subunit)
LENKLLSTFWIAGIGIRRALYIPSQLNYDYYDYFSKNEPDYLRQGILRWFGFSSPYKESIPHLIGYHYYGSIEMGANNGLFSDAYFNFNFLGVFLFPIILIIIFKLFDTCSKGLDSKLLILPIIVCTTSFISGCFSSVLLTDGIALLMITLYFMVRGKRA